MEILVFLLRRFAENNVPPLNTNDVSPFLIYVRQRRNLALGAEGMRGGGSVMGIGIFNFRNNRVPT
jgi:hypothetical protein